MQASQMYRIVVRFKGTAVRERYIRYFNLKHLLIIGNSPSSAFVVSALSREMTLCASASTLLLEGIL